MNFLREKLHKAYQKKEIEKHYLQYLFFEITRKCNLNCLHCGSDCTKNLQSPELTTGSWLKIIDYFNDNFGKNVAFVITGGEPLMHPDLFQITKHIQKHGIRWGMVTNGMLLDILHMEKLLDTGIYSLTISVDGLEENHNWLRNSKQAFKKLLISMEMMGKAKLSHKDVVTCVSPMNLDELDKIAGLILDKGIRDWRLFRIFPSGRAKGDPNLQLTFNQTQTLLEWIEKNRPIYSKKGLNINLSCEGWLPFSREQKLRDLPFFCRSGINIASILADGTVTGCSNNSSGFHVGNILTDNFAWLWENKFNIFRDRTWLNETECASCRHFGQCRGSSIHLWEIGNSRPNFCYAVDLENLKKINNIHLSA